jgi:predicted unusual protein kinase regulating ubiquinone biosynthesis (AarF/ABC1/UbiB family)
MVSSSFCFSLFYFLEKKMHKIILVLYFFCFSSTNSIAANENAQDTTEEFKSFFSKLLEAGELTSKDERYQSYRSTLQDFPSVLLKLRSDDYQTYLKRNPFLAVIFAQQKSSLLFSFVNIVDWDQIGGHKIFSALDGIKHLGKAFAPFMERSNQWLYLSDRSLDQLEKAINTTVGVFKFSKSPAIKMLLDPKEGLELDKAPPFIAEFLKLVLEQYFDALDIATKRAILADVLRLKDDAPSDEVLAIILNHCGPVIQKAFQLFSKDVRSPQVQQILNRLRANIKPFSTDLAKKIIQDESGINIAKTFKNFPDKPIAAATMGQVYLVKNKKNEKVIVKVQRPNLQQKAEGEFALLRKLTQSDTVLRFIEELKEALDEELDFANEIENIKEAEFYHGQMNGKLNTIGVVTKYKSTSKVLFLTCADGKNIDKFSEDSDEVKEKALTELLRVWVREAIFGVRVFHADLHPGNIFLDVEPENGDEYSMTLLDFGSMGRFNQDEAKSLVKIMLGLSFSIRSLVREGINAVATEELSADLVDKLIKEVFENDIEQDERAEFLFNHGIEMGLALPKSFIQFYRGQAFLEKQIKEIFERVHGEEDGEALAKEHIANVYKSVFKWDILSDIWGTACQIHDEECPAYIDSSVIKAFFFRAFSWGGVSK